MVMSGEWIPIVGTVSGCAFVVAMVALGNYRKLEDARMRIEAEIQQMEMAYQRARESFSR
jgi:hypothetical protein